MALSSRELESTFGELLNKVEILSDRIEISELSGGLTNRNLKVSTSNGTYVARISSNESELLSIDRRAEYENSKIAAEMGVGAKVIDYLPNQGLLVIGFISGKTYTSVDVEQNISRIAHSVRQLHQSKAFVRDFNMFEIQQKYLEIVKTKGFKLPAGYEDYEKYRIELQEAFNKTHEGNVPCNNDLLPANFIDDGKKIWLIDYEYSGNNDACFELGNIWSEANLSLDALAELVTAYYEKPRPDKFARAWLFSLLAKYGWTLWAAIQNEVSEIEFDFWEWGMAKYEAVQRDLGSSFYKEQLKNLYS